MSWFSTIVTAVITAAVGTVLSGYVANMAVRWYNISGFEGKSGYFVVAMALMGLMGGLVVGVIVSRVIAATANPGILKAMGISVATIMLLVAIVGSAGRLRADVPPTVDGEELMLMVEARWPATHTESPAAVPGVSYLNLGSVTSSRVQRASRRGALWKEDAKQVDGRWVVPGAVHLFTGRGSRSLDIALNDSVVSGFMIRLGSKPNKADFEWSEWYPKDGRTGPTKETGVTYRHRVQKVSMPIRTETVGAFEVAAIANGFQTEIPEGTTTLDPYARFEVRYRGQPVRWVNDSSATTDSIKQVGMLAVLPSEKPALLAYVEPPEGTSFCALLVDEGATMRQERVDVCYNSLQTEELTSDSARFAAMKSVAAPHGRVDRRTYAKSSALLFNSVVMNVQTLAINRVSAKSETSFIPSVPPLGISPDSRSYVRYHTRRENPYEPILLVTDFVRDSMYELPIDGARMRYARLGDLTPDWVLHHFKWQRGADGVDELKERADFVPIPYHGEITPEEGGKFSYEIRKVGQEMRMALMEYLEKEFSAHRDSVAASDYEYPITVQGKKLKVANSGTSDYVLLSMAHEEAPSNLVAEIGRGFNTVLATGRHDSLFAK